MPKGPPPAEGKRAWDWHSRAGREALDTATLRVVAVEYPDRPSSRGLVAAYLGVGKDENGLKAVGASLKRNEAAGHVWRHGFGQSTTYEATKAGREAAKGAGR